MDFALLIGLGCVLQAAHAAVLARGPAGKRCEKHRRTAPPVRRTMSPPARTFRNAPGVANSIPKYVNEDDAKSGTKPRPQRLEKPVPERGDPHMNEAPVQPLPQGYQWKTVRKHDRHDVIGQ